MSKLSKSGRELSGTEKILIGSVTVLAVAFILWVLVISPSLDKIKPLEEEVAGYKKQVGNTEMLKSEIETKEKQLVDLRSKYEEYTKTLPKTDRYPELIKELREMAIDAGLKIETETLGKPVMVQVTTEQTEATTTTTPGEANSETQKEGLKTITLSLNVSGDFNQVLDYVKKLEADKRILDVTQISSDNKSTTLQLVYYISGVNEKEEYDFNTGSYGKDNIFN